MLCEVAPPQNLRNYEQQYDNQIQQRTSSPLMQNFNLSVSASCAVPVTLHFRILQPSFPLWHCAASKDEICSTVGKDWLNTSPSNEFI